MEHSVLLIILYLEFDKITMRSTCFSSNFQEIAVITKVINKVRDRRPAVHLIPVYPKGKMRVIGDLLYV